MLQFPRRAALALLTVLGAAPLLAQEANFGRAIAMTASELAIGQPVNWYGPGTVYLYRLDASGRWQEQQRVTASDTLRKDDFGHTLALDGNTLIVGAPRKESNVGVVYAFSRASATAPWREVARLSAPAAGLFGSALALSGDELLVGAPAVRGGGIVYRYARRSGGWQLSDSLRPASLDTSASFGSSLSWQDASLLIGAPGDNAGVGRAYLATRAAGGGWSVPSAVNIPRAGAERAALGASVLLDGDRAFVGAPGAMLVHVLSRDANGNWSAAGELRAFDGGRGTQFGAAFATVGRDVWVGAPGANGRVYRFLADSVDGWRGAASLIADSSRGTSWPFSFGFAIASAGDRAAVSMPTRDFGEGRVLALTRRAAEWEHTQLLTGPIAAISDGATPAASCTAGKVGVYTCNNVDLVAHMPVSALGGERGVWVNDVWGWTDPQTRRDYALVARRDGASFVDVTDPSNPKLVGTLPRTDGAPPSVWRDIKVIGNHAYIVADGAGAHGVQVFDLTRLRTARDVPTFAPDTTYREIASAHNIVADTASGFLYVVGANSGGETCGGGLHIIDARVPTALTFTGCYNDRSGANPRGYSHDAQCVNYQGPDTRYRGREICVGSNEKEINIADVTDKTKPVTIGRNSYPNVSYAHQGWFDAEQRFFYMNDEGDENDGLVEGTRTIVWDLTDLGDPVVAKMYYGPVKSSDHNLYVVGNRVFEANYGSGLRVLDISDRASPREIGFFDSAPFNDDGPGFSATQSGAWSNYPFFKSGVVIFTSVREGLFIVRVRDFVP
jgi:choice-of-anchor B domain-containing protein